MSTVAIDISILLNILGLGQGLVLSFSLYGNRKEKPENQFLIVLLCAISLIILNSIFRLSYYIEAMEFYQDFSNSFLLLIAPSIYLFVCAKLGQAPKGRWLHYAPFVFYFLFLLITYFTLGPNSEIKETVSMAFYLLFNLQYVVLLGKSLRMLKEGTSHSKPLRWIKVAVWLILIPWAMQVLILIIEQAAKIPVPGFISLNLSLFFGICTFYLSYMHASGISGFAQKEKYEGSRLTQQMLSENLKRIESTILNEKLFEDKDFSQSKLAEKIDLTARTISLTINQGKGQNFVDFINGIRIEAFKQMIVEEQHKNYTMVAIAEMCGFKSSSTFYAAFKKQTGMTPKEYKDSLS